MSGARDDDVTALYGAERPPSHRRMRRRGPRSLQACIRRYHRFVPPVASPAESGVDAADPVFVQSPRNNSLFSVGNPRESSVEGPQCVFPSISEASPKVEPRSPSDTLFSGCFEPSRDSQSISPECLCIISVNIRSILTHRAELEARLRDTRAHIVCIQETWLDESVECLHIEGYKVVSRRDRTGTSKDGYGGILVLAREDFQSVAELRTSEKDERQWCAVHTAMGPILLGNWYRPPDDDAAQSMPRVRAELAEMTVEFIGTILVGDVNIHHRRWLVHSNRNSSEGHLLYDISCDFGLVQGVREPTRGDYLLDVVLSDMHSLASTKVLPPIADHGLVMSTFDVGTVTIDPVERFVWDFHKANWHEFRSSISNVDWKTLLAAGSVDDVVEKLTHKILEVAKAHIPSRIAKFSKKSHPWITERALTSIRAKCEAYGSDSYHEKERQCREIIAEEYRFYTQRLKRKISGLPRGSKRWWSLNRQLLHKTTKTTSIPPLKTADGRWITDPEEKAQLLSDTFAAKSVLPPPPTDPAEYPEPTVKMSGFLVIRARAVKRILKALNVSKATGPDRVPARLLRECSTELAAPLAVLARRMLNEAVWPESWRLHWIHPLFKKGSVANSSNYRGVHLTPVLSKVMERVVATIFVPFLDKSGAFGRSQWAFRPGHSCRDLVALKFAQWILAMGRGSRVGLFLSDISGAFDRVDSEILLQKCASIGLGDRVCAFLRAFLEPRRAIVLVQGKCSREKVIDNEVYQGTVLGPPLWNVHFADVSVPVVRCGFRENKFADDLSCDKTYDKSVLDSDIFADLAECQRNVHVWGEQNRVKFDPSKEEMRILHTQRAHGDVFKFLGPKVDTKLTMDVEVRRLRQKTRPKVKAILRTRVCYDEKGLIGQYKAHVLPVLEASVGAIYHASNTQLKKIDGVQASFLHGLCLSPQDAFLRYNLAPLQLRRDIGILGLLFKVASGLAHPDFELLFRIDNRERNWHTRFNENLHPKQFVDICDGSQSELVNRSIFSADKVWNRLPGHLLDVSSVRAFQRLLTERARHACRDGVENWEYLYSRRKDIR